MDLKTTWVLPNQAGQQPGHYYWQTKGTGRQKSGWILYLKIPKIKISHQVAAGTNLQRNVKDPDSWYSYYKRGNFAVVRNLWKRKILPVQYGTQRLDKEDIQNMLRHSQEKMKVCVPNLNMGESTNNNMITKNQKTGQKFRSKNYKIICHNIFTSGVIFIPTFHSNL